MQTKGIVFDIARFCTNDGPGIRTTVFLKGCPLRCAWCHNPESQEIHPDILFDEEKCVHCGKCVYQCVHGCHSIEAQLHIFNRTNCTFCGDCVQKCFGALRKAGYETTVETVMNEILQDKVFYLSSGGGLTLSGGEPLFQYAFTIALLKHAKENGLHTCVETCGYAKPEKFEAILPYTNLFLFDFKETNPLLHQKFTEVDNKMIIENLVKLNAVGKKIILCCPIIPGLNDRVEHFNGIAQMANRLTNIMEVRIKPYHSLGEAKYTLLGRKSNIKATNCTDTNMLKLWVDEVQKRTIKPVNYDG